MQLGANVRMRRIGEEAVLVDLDRGLYFSLNESGQIILSVLMEGGEASDAVRELQLLFRVNPADAENDVRRLLHVLRQKGLIE